MKTVLIADDTKNIRVLLSTCLELEGYRVMTASSGQEALELFEKETFDLAFLDIKMPEMSGTEVLKTIREKGIQTPVIIITAFATVKNAVECTRMGAVAYLQKPFTADKVKHVLEGLYEMKGRKQDQLEQDNLEACVEKFIEEKDYNKGLDLVKKAIASDPSNGKFYRLLGELYTAMGDEMMADKFRSVSQLLSEK